MNRQPHQTPAKECPVARLILGALKRAPQEINPAVRLSFELEQRAHAGTLTEAELINRHKEIETAIMDGTREATNIGDALRKLEAATSTPARRPPPYF